MFPFGSFVLACLVLPRAVCGFQPATSSLRRHENPLAFAAISLVPIHKGVHSSVATYKSTGFFASTADTDGQQKIDTDALVKYACALVIQLGLVTIFFTGLDKLVATFNFSVPFAANCLFFYFFALKSRVFNPLSNQRPQVENKEIAGIQERKMPSWTPPGFVFPVVWLLIIGPLRAYTTSLIYATTGSYANGAILSLMLHLSVGDIWNTINNVERRYGTSVLGVLCVWISAAFAAFRYYKVLPLAGKLLSLKLIWLTIASSLIFQTWRINPEPGTGKRHPLLPTTGLGKNTEFTWF